MSSCAGVAPSAGVDTIIEGMYPLKRGVNIVAGLPHMRMILGAVMVASWPALAAADDTPAGPPDGYLVLPFTNVKGALGLDPYIGALAGSLAFFVVSFWPRS